MRVLIFTFKFIQCCSMTELNFSFTGLRYRIFANTEIFVKHFALTKKGLALISNSEGCTGC